MPTVFADQSTMPDSMSVKSLSLATPAGKASREPELRALLEAGFFGLRSLPEDIEAGFRQSARAQAAQTLRHSIYGLIALYLLVVVPISLFSEDVNLSLWQLYAMFPIGVVLACIWVTTRFPQMDRHVETTLSISLFICLCGTLYCAMLLGKQYYGQVAAYETIYILIVVFSVLQLPTGLTLRWSLAAFAQIFLIALIQKLPLLWLEMLLYYGVPLLICTVVGYMLEYSARRDYVQRLCLHYKQQELGLLQEVSAAANEAETVEMALQFALDKVCAYTGWPVGHAALTDPDRPGELLSSSAWHMARPRRFEEVKKLNEFARHGARTSLAYAALSTGQIAASHDLASMDDDHAYLVKATGLRTGLAVPIKVGIDVVAVLEFFSEQPLPAEESWAETIEHVGAQLARVFERQKRYQANLLHAALHDALTGLPNRAFLLDHIRRALVLSRRRDTRFCVLFIDVDRFKWVNDSYGHASGDALLVEVAKRLQASLRPNDIVARLGGDEFAVLLHDVESTEEGLVTARRIHEQLSRPIHMAEHDALVTASVGIALSASRYKTPEELLRDADTAMYHAKGMGRNGSCAIFAEYMHEKAAGRLMLTSELRRAIKNGSELELRYQPIVAVDTGYMQGAEALVRWRHPQRGLLSPDIFIPLAEETGLISPLTDWVLLAACKQLAEWQKTPGTAALYVSVNMCARSFSDPAMPEFMRTLLDENAIEPGSLRLEVTETQLMENAEAFALNLELLKVQGIPVYIDDFGTGYSSLSYLSSFRVNALKVDRSFVGRLNGDARETSIVRTIVALGHSLGMTVIAEGVETREQLDYLRGLNCQHVQGYLFSPPVEASALPDLAGQRFFEPDSAVRLAEVRG